MVGIVSLARLRRAVRDFSLYDGPSNRFHINKSFYVSEVENSTTSPKFVVFDWGKIEFIGAPIHYFLVFDPNNSIARGLANPMDMPLPDERTKCSTSVLPLYGSFYSVTVDCELT